ARRHQRRIEIPGLLHEDGERGAMDHVAHLLDDAGVAVVEDLEQDLIDRHGSPLRSACRARPRSYHSSIIDVPTATPPPRASARHPPGPPCTWRPRPSGIPPPARARLSWRRAGPGPDGNVRPTAACRATWRSRARRGSEPPRSRTIWHLGTTRRRR